MKTVFRKMLLLNTLLILGVTIVAILISARFIHDNYVDTLKASLENIALILDKSISSDIESPKSLQSFFIDLALPQKDLRITLFHPDGSILFDTLSESSLISNHLRYPEVKKAVKGEKAYVTRYSSFAKKQILYVAQPIFRAGNIIGVLRVGGYMKSSRSTLNQIWIKVGFPAFMILIFVFIVIFIISKKITYPIKLINDALQKMAEGEFSTTLSLAAKNEFNTIAMNFNQMSKKISALFKEVQTQKEDIQTLVDSLPEGLLVTDIKTGKIHTMNAACKKICNLSAIPDYYWNIFSQTEFDVLLKKAIYTGDPSQQELVLNNKVYLVTVSFYHNNYYAVCVFQDITALKHINDVKKNIVDNVSHELRTPLTAINGFIEIIEEEADLLKQKNYIQIIKKHTNRLIRIVNDLLELSQVENGFNDKGEDIVDLPVIISDILQMFQKIINQKGLSLNINYPKNKYKPNILGDRFQLEQVIINLLDNAIKYTDQGSIFINVETTDKEVVFVLTDTGQGIPEDCQAKIFERFYVVDKSRSREKGGTGLGLSIVKHIVLIHDGKIEVDSSLGQGTTFRLCFPRHISDQIQSNRP